MSNERYNQIIDNAYNNYTQTKIIKTDSGETHISPPGHYNGMVKEQFINKCKTDIEFSETWGLKIEERELSLEERIVIKNSKNIFISKGYIDDNGYLNDIGRLKLDKLIPTKLITLTYNNETIESYE